MLIEFDEISDNSRLWIYGSERAFSDQEQNYIIQKIGEYLNTWVYHNNPLTASVSILEDHFIFIALDDNEFGVGGCSIDSLQRIIQSLEKECSLSLMNRLNIFCRIDEEIQCIPSLKLSSVATLDTLFYDLTIQKKKEIDSYLRPISEGWCAYLLN